MANGDPWTDNPSGGLRISVEDHPL